jgi:hypothetical protein
MPRKATPLTDMECRNAKPREKLYKLTDGGGLYLEVTPAGGKHWRMKYYFVGKEKVLTIGPYPRINLSAARKKRDNARDQLDAGLDPAGERKAQLLTAKLAANTTFEGVAREWFGREKEKWVDTHAARVIRRFERDIFPHVGMRPIATITTPEILAVLRKIENRGALETAHRAKWDCSQVFLYAIETGRAERNPTETMSKGALKQPTVRNHAAVIKPKEIGQLIRAIRGYKGSEIVRAALQLAPLVFLRPGELRQAQWAEFGVPRVSWRVYNRLAGIAAWRWKWLHHHAIRGPGSRMSSSRGIARSSQYRPCARCWALLRAGITHGYKNPFQIAREKMLDSCV